MNTAQQPRVGFIGLGSQGGPMARRIVDAGFPTTLWARRAETLEPFASTEARIACTPSELGAACDIVGVCVVDDVGVDEVLRGAEGVLEALADDSIVVIHSTVHPATCLRLQHDHPRLRFLDAPVSGGGHKAAVGELLVMVGGDPHTLEQCAAVLDTFGDPIVHVGPLGAGQEMKVLNNTVFSANLAVAADAFALARQRGLDLASVSRILGSGSGRSFAADVVAGGGHDLTQLAPLAGGLLAKDVGILADHTGLDRSLLFDAARHALELMGIDR